MMNQDEFREAVINMRHSPASLERRGECWSEEDKGKLSEMFFDNVGITEMAVILQRSETARRKIYERMEQF